MSPLFHKLSRLLSRKESRRAVIDVGVFISALPPHDHVSFRARPGDFRADVVGEGWIASVRWGSLRHASLTLRNNDGNSAQVIDLTGQTQWRRGDDSADSVWLLGVSTAIFEAVNESPL